MGSMCSSIGMKKTRKRKIYQNYRKKGKFKNAELERTSSYFSYPSKPLVKTLKDKVFVSFNTEFKLKYYRKSTKTNNLLLIFWDSMSSYLSHPSKIHE